MKFICYVVLPDFTTQLKRKSKSVKFLDSFLLHEYCGCTNEKENKKRLEKENPKNERKEQKKEDWRRSSLCTHV